MQDKEKIEVFKTELSYITLEEVRKFTKVAITKLPDYFFKIAASTGGKYHPEFAAGEGGLVRHTKAAVRIAKELFRLEMFDGFTGLEKDLILASLILHDGFKAGMIGTHTVVTHPILMADFIRTDESLKGILHQDFLDIIADNIKTHMGQWVEDWGTKEVVLEKPSNKMQSFVHLCDYLVSRKCVEMNLDAPLSK